MDSFEKMYAVKEAAAVLGFGRDTVLRLIRRKKLRAWKLPTEEARRKRKFESWRVPQSELERFIRRNEN